MKDQTREKIFLILEPTILDQWDNDPDIDGLVDQLEALIQEQKQEMLDELWDAYKTAASMDDCSDAECVVRRLKSMRKEEGKDKEE